MNPIPTIIIQAPNASANNQTTFGSNHPVFAEIRIVLFQGLTTATSREDATTYQIPLVIQLPVQKEVKRCGKRKLKQKRKAKPQQQRQNQRSQNTTETNQIEIDTVPASEDAVRGPVNDTSGHSTLVEFIQQPEGTIPRITTCDMTSTANKALQVPASDTPSPTDIEPTSDDTFWNMIDDDIDRMVNESTTEELATIINRAPPSQSDLFDELFG